MQVAHAFQHLEIMGQRATFFGRPTDEYFARLPAFAAQNTAFVRELINLPRDAFVIDVGANIGVTAVTASRAVANGKVIAIEPSPTAYGHLVQSLGASGAENVTTVRACLGRECGSIPFQESDYLGGAVALDRGPETIDVRLMTLDSLMQEHQWNRVDLIKIDVDGPELDVLLGARETIARHRPRFVMEFAPFCLAWTGNISPRALLEFVLDTFGGFECERDGITIIIQTEKEAKDFLFSSMAYCSVRVDDIVFGGR